jgi:predicted N-formylglutamate amidohydrolase
LSKTLIRLLAEDEPTAFIVSNEGGRSPFFIACDHAGKRLPRRIGKLGLPDCKLEGHIASDIGAGSVACLVGNALDAFVIRQTYSRLIIDCNRPPGAETSIVEISEATTVAGNIGLSAGQKEARVREIFRPYHDRIVAELDKRRQSGHPTVLISMHSFTPVFKSVVRPWHVGVLYRDTRFAPRLYDPHSRRTAGSAPCGARNSPRPDRGCGGSEELGGVAGPLAAGSLSASHCRGLNCNRDISIGFSRC